MCNNLIYNYIKKENEMNFSEPIELLEARKLLEEWESTDWKVNDSEAHYRSLGKWNCAFDLLSEIKSYDANINEIITNIRSVQARRLYIIIHENCETATETTYFTLLFARIKLIDEMEEVIRSLK